MSTTSNKEKHSYYLNSETVELIKECQKEEGLKTQSMYVERAIKFYSGYLKAKEKDTYLPTIMDNLFECHVGGLEDKMCMMLFKIAVQLAKILHVICALNNVTEENMDAVHDSVVREVRATNGYVSFEKILEFQNSQKK